MPHPWLPGDTGSRRPPAQAKRVIRILTWALLAAGLLLSTPAAAIAPPTTTAATSATDSPAPLGVAGTWRLTLDAGPAQLARWNAWTGTGSPVNPYELDCYRARNIVTHRSYLSLRLTRRPSTCVSIGKPFSNNKPFTGALITSRGIFAQRYGVWEAEVYLPASRSGRISDWPAVWLDGNHAAGGNVEIDITEALSGQACQLMHNTSGNSKQCMSIAPGWHVFSVEVTARELTFWFDGHLVSQVSTTAYTMPLFAVLDMTVHLKPLIVPASLKIAWVRAWQRAPR